MDKPNKPIPPGHELEKIANRAATTVPTVRNYLRGAPGKPRIAARVRAALLDMGLVDLVPPHKAESDR